jgi:hypothetical protein
MDPIAFRFGLGIGIGDWDWDWDWEFGFPISALSKHKGQKVGEYNW